MFASVQLAGPPGYRIASLDDSMNVATFRVGVGMDSISLIVAALTAGAATGLKDTASAAITDAYENVKALIMKRLADRQDGELILGQHEQAPQAWEVSLAAELAAAEAGRDADLTAAAQTLMRLLDESGYRAGKYSVDARSSQGVQVGDHNIQHNAFGSLRIRTAVTGWLVE